MYLAKPFEYFNFSIEGHVTNAVFKIKAFNIISYIFYRSFYLTIMIFSLIEGPTKYNSFLMDTGNYIFLIICYSVSGISSIFLFASNYSFHDVIKNCYKVDTCLEQFGIVINHQKLFMSYLKYIVSDIVLFGTMNLISIQVYQSSALQNVVPFGHLMIVYCIYIILLSVVIARFESINLCLM